ncbi:UNVERIFIED_ORG: hypothetical protein J2W19_002695 [Shinella zoogloeoides]|nr:hypothetical protein [Shinella zoogloeoides]
MSTPIDDRREILACKRALRDETVRFFPIGASNRHVVEGEERGIDDDEWSANARVPVDEDLLAVGQAYSNSARVGSWATVMGLGFNLMMAYFVFAVGYFLVDTVLTRSTSYNRVGIALAIFVIGASIFAWRERAKLSYGLFEVIVGVAISYDVFTSSALAADGVGTPAMLQFAAGLYVIVRGLDNVGKALRWSELARLWQWVFEGRRLPANDEHDLEEFRATLLRSEKSNKRPTDTQYDEF